MIEIMGTTFVELVTSPYLMGLILLAIPLGMFFGAVRGVVAPETANNAKEGGSLCRHCSSPFREARAWQSCLAPS